MRFRGFAFEGPLTLSTGFNFEFGAQLAEKELRARRFKADGLGRGEGVVSG